MRFFSGFLRTLCTTCFVIAFAFSSLGAYADTCPQDYIEYGNGQCAKAEFTLTTNGDQARGDSFSFYISAKGTFYVDCGNGGVLSGTGVDTDGKTIIRESTASSTYKCQYDNYSVTSTIRFGGEATEYHPYKSPTIGFQTKRANASSIKAISGSLGHIFKTLNDGSNDLSKQPQFIQTFQYAEIQSLPVDEHGKSILFDGVFGSATSMFEKTFSECRYLAEIPEGLFKDVSGGADYMFHGTFETCGRITSLPTDLFDGVTHAAHSIFGSTFIGCIGLASLPKDQNGNSTLFKNLDGSAANYMFSGTFNGCSGLTSLPPKLFANFNSTADGMFFETFKACSGLTSLPLDLFNNVNDAKPSMFSGTFQSCTGLTYLPTDLNGKSTLFKNIQGSANNLFSYTFYDCSGLTSLPSDLFSTIDSAADNMFYATFAGCSGLTSLPTDANGKSSLFKTIEGSAYQLYALTFQNCTGLTSLPPELFGHTNGAANSMFSATFNGCRGLTSLPTDANGESTLFGNIDGAGDYMFQGTFMNCTGLTSLPKGLFKGISGSIRGMFDRTFIGCTGLTTIPSSLFDGVSGTPKTRMFYQTFNGDTSLNTFDWGNNKTTDYIPPTFFGTMTSTPDSDYFMTDVFKDTDIAEACDNDMIEYKPGFESYWSPKVSCISCPEHYDWDPTTSSCVTTAYTITYNLGHGSWVTGTVVPDSYIDTDLPLTLPVPISNGYIFGGWYDNAGLTGTAITEISANSTGNKEFWAKWDARATCQTDEIYYEPDDICIPRKFWMDLDIPDDNKEFEFMISAAGTFYVDCGAGGSLSGTYNDVNGTRIYRPSSEPSPVGKRVYKCTYTTGGQKTINFAGEANGYATGPASISFNYKSYMGMGGSYEQFRADTNVHKIKGIYGSLGSIFKSVANPQNGWGSEPTFNQTFSGGENIEGEIPTNIFSGVTGTAPSMFSGTFAYCSKITGSIPDFSQINGPGQEHMFAGTFYKCSNLNREIPHNSFLGIRTAAQNMFFDTFYYCSSLPGSVPSFKNIVFNGADGENADYMFYSTFYYCSGLNGTIPSDAFDGIKSTAPNMFDDTFYHCSSLTGGIPDFSQINGPGKENMFRETFYYCFGLNGEIPHNNFLGIRTAAQGMFFRTFAMCKSLTGPVPSFKNVVFNGTEDEEADSMFNSTFSDCHGLTGPIPSDAFESIKSTAINMFASTFNNCYKLKSTVPDFSNISGAGKYRMFYYTFSGCRSLEGSIPLDIFDGITSLESGMFYRTFADCSNLNKMPDADGVVHNYIDESFLYKLYNSETDYSTDNIMTYMFAYSGFENPCPAGTYEVKPEFGSAAAKPWCTPCPEGFTSISGQNANINQCFTSCPATDTYDGVFESGSNIYYVGPGVPADYSGCVYKYTISYNLGGYDASLNAVNPTEYLSNMDSDLTINPLPDQPTNIFEGWYSDANFTTPIDKITAGSYGNQTIYAKWSEIPYIIKYLDEDNNQLLPDTVWFLGKGQAFNLQDPTLPDDWLFHGWYLENTIKTNGADATNKITQQITEEFVLQHAVDHVVTLYGFKYPKPVFWITTTPDTNTFKFYWGSTRGDLWIEWGDGTVKRSERDKTTRDRSDILHNYSETKEYRIGFSSKIISYHNEPNTNYSLAEYEAAYHNVVPRSGSCNSSITLGKGRYETTYDKIAKIEGSIGKLFPSIDNDELPWAQRHPILCEAFDSAINLTSSIPDGFFDGITGMKYLGFEATFYNSGITGQIPRGLFKDIQNKKPLPGAFSALFEGCSGLTGQIPEDLFSWLSGDIEPMTFSWAFTDATGLTGPIPENLFANVTGVASQGFFETFQGATNLGKDDNGKATPIPAGLFRSISGDITGTQMFAGTFEDTDYLNGTVPVNLFSGISGFLDDNDDGTQVSNTPYTTGGMGSIFNNSGIEQQCDAGYYQYLTGFEVDWNGRVACKKCPDDFPYSRVGDNVTINKCFRPCPTDPYGGAYVSGDTYWSSDINGIGDSSQCVYKYTISYNLGGYDASLNAVNPTEYLSNMDSDLTISPLPNQPFFDFVGWYADNTFTIPVDKISIGEKGNKTLYAKWGFAGYIIKYVDDDGNDLMPSTIWHPGETETFEIPIPTLDKDTTFYGWASDTDFNSDTSKLISLTEEYVLNNADENYTVKVHGLTYPASVFFMTTTPMESGETFAFYVKNTSGTVYIDWDDGTVQKVDGNIGLVEHTYVDAGTYIIGLSSENITGYTMNNETFTDKCSGTLDAVFWIGDGWNETSYKNGTREKLARISGDLSAVFPTMPDDTQPSFANAFNGCSNLEGEIPYGMFAHITGQPRTGMFSKTFKNCSKLGTENDFPTYSIPQNLFGGLNGTYTDGLFESTFYNTSGLTGSIPADTVDSATNKIKSGLFGKLSGEPKKCMFSNTFSGDSGLTGVIPENLFGDVNGTPETRMFSRTFYGCSNLTGPIPGKLFCHDKDNDICVKGTPAPYMFYATFYNCQNIDGQIPENLFGKIKGRPAENMFAWTFAECGKIGSENNVAKYGIPDKLFGTFDNKAPAPYMFYATFWNCSNLTGPLPENLFNTIFGKPADSMFALTFANCSKLGELNGSPTYGIPSNMFAGIYGYPAPHMFEATFEGTSISGQIPENLFCYNRSQGLCIGGKPAENMFAETFAFCPYISGTIPTGLFGNVNGTPASQMFYGTFMGDELISGFDNGKQYISPDYMSAITETGYKKGPMSKMFKGTGLLEHCPAGTYEIKKFDDDWQPKVVCDECGDVYPHSDTNDNQSHKKCYANVTYITNNGSENIVNQQHYSDRSPYSYSVDLPVLSLEGYNFLGWFEDEHLDGEKVDMTNNHFTGDITLYAKYEEIVPEPFVCKSREWLHLGNGDKLCLSDTKTSSPAMGFKIRNKKYYLSMTTDTDKPINETSSTKMHVHYKGKEYNIHDASID